MNYDGYIVVGQSQVNGAKAKSGAPSGVFTGNLLTGCKVYNGSAIVNYDVTSIGPSGNGSTWVNVGSSSNGNYAWWHISAYREYLKGRNPLIIQLTEGGSSMDLRTVLTGSHNTDTATLTSTYPTTPRLHADFVTRFNSLVAHLASNGDTITWRMVFFSQGESDVDFASQRITYLTNKFAAFRTLTGNANLPIFYTTIPKVSTLKSDYLRETDLHMATLSANNKVVDLYNGTVFDTVHYDDATMLLAANIVTEILTPPAAPTVFLNSRPPMIVVSKEVDALKRYVDATGISGDSVVAAETYIRKMKLYGLWDKVVAAFLCLGTTGAQHRINIKNPSHRNLTITGASSSANGLSFDGVDDFVETGFNVQGLPALRSSNFGVDVYSRTNGLTGQKCVASWNETGGVLFRLFVTYDGVLRMDISSSGFNLISESLVDTYGLFSGQVRGGNAEIYKDGVNRGVKAYVANEYVNNFLHFGYDIPGGNVRYLDKELSYMAYRQAFTPDEMRTYYSIIQEYQSIMARQVATVFAIPTYAQVLSRSSTEGFTNPNSTWLAKLQTLMESVGDLLARCNRAYIFKNGGAADDFSRINLANPITGDLMTWPSGKTYSANGVQLNGTSHYGDFNFDPSTQGEGRYLLNSNGRYYWMHAISGTAALDGAITTASRNTTTPTNGTANRNNSGSVAITVAADLTGTPDGGFKANIRRGFDTITLFNGNTKMDRALLSSVLLNQKQVLGRNGANYAAHTYKAYFIGAEFNDDEVARLTAAMAVYEL